MKIKIFYTSEGIDEKVDKMFIELLKDFEFVGSGYNFVKKERDLEFDSQKEAKEEGVE